MGFKKMWTKKGEKKDGQINTLVKYTYTEHIHHDATKIYLFVFWNSKYEIVD